MKVWWLAMSSPNKVARVEPPDSPVPEEGVASTVAQLPDELWRAVARTYPGNYDLNEVLSFRRINRVFADELRYRVYAHIPDTAQFVREMRLMFAFNNRFHEVVNGLRNHTNHIVLRPISKVARVRQRFGGLCGANQRRTEARCQSATAQTGFSSGRGSPTGVGYALKSGRES